MLDTPLQADTIYLYGIRQTSLSNTISQAFAMRLPVGSVGEMGGGKPMITSARGHLSRCRTADYYILPHSFLCRMAHRNIHVVLGVNGVVYDVTSKTPGTIE